MPTRSPDVIHLKVLSVEKSKLLNYTLNIFQPGKLFSEVYLWLLCFCILIHNMFSGIVYKLFYMLYKKFFFTLKSFHFYILFKMETINKE